MAEIKQPGKPSLLVFLLFIFLSANSQVVYPYPLQQIPVMIEDSVVPMAYMDVKPEEVANGKTLLLLHGKNFNGYSWKKILSPLARQGYRIIVPDQVGWGRSGKPLVHYTFSMLAKNTADLLDSLHLQKIIVIGHSMGGMLAARFTMMYPSRVEKLVLENPIGLEDYKRFVPYRTTQQLTLQEQKATYASYKKYQQSYYPAWKEEYEPYVAAQAEALTDPAFPAIAKVNALTYQMIYEEPVCYEWDRITVPVLLIIGQADRTVVGKDQLTDTQKKIYGQYPALGRKTKQQLKNAMLAELPGIGHIPHIQDTELFLRHLLPFLR